MKLKELIPILTGSNYKVFIRDEGKVIDFAQFYLTRDKYQSYELVGMICDSNKPLEIVLERRGD